MPDVKVQIRPPILRITLARPEKRNALTEQMLTELRSAVDAAAERMDFSVVVVDAEGDHFCAGYDLNEIEAQESLEARFVRERRVLFDLAAAIRNLPQPTIAVVQGGTVAAGLLISQSCDLVAASDDAFFYNPLVKMGGVGLEVLLEPYDLGFRRAKRILFTGARVSASEALELGMITDLVPRDQLEPAVSALIEKVCALPPLTLRLLKRSINAAEDMQGRRAGIDNHFNLHEFGHATGESRSLLHEERIRRNPTDYIHARETGWHRDDC